MQYDYRLTHIKQFILRAKHSIWKGLLFIIILLLAAMCQSAETTEPENVITEDVVDLSPLLIQAEDMEWSSGYHNVDKEFDGLPPLGPKPPQEVWHVIISPIPGTGGGKYPIRHDDMRSGSQTVYVFKDEMTAQKEFEVRAQRLSQLSAGGWGLWNMPPNDHIDNSFARCHHFDTSGFGRLEECDAQVQLGPYHVEFGMVIDGDFTTKEDWANMFEIVQERLIEHVTQNP